MNSELLKSYLSIESSWYISKELPEICLALSGNISPLSVPLLHNFAKTTPHRPKKKLPKNKGREKGGRKKTRKTGIDGTWTPRIDGASPKLTSSACSKSSRSWHATTFNRRRYVEVVVPLKKQCRLSLGWKMLCCFWACFLSQCSALFCWLSLVFTKGLHVSSVTTVMSDVCWWLHSSWLSWLENFVAESNRMKQSDHFCLPSNLRLQLRGTLPLRHLLCPSVVSLVAADFLVAAISSNWMFERMPPTPREFWNLAFSADLGNSHGCLN